MIKEKRTIRLWEVTDISIDEMVNTHIEYVTAPRKEIVNWEKFLVCDGVPAEPKYKIVKEPKPAPRKLILYTKYRYLVHLIIGKVLNSSDNVIHLNGRVLRNVLGDHVYDMLHVLDKMGIIELGSDYIMGEQSRGISLLDFNITHRDLYNLQIMKYKERMDLLMSNFSCYQKGNDKEDTEQIYDDKFFKHYNESLFKLDLRNKDAAIDFIEREIVNPNNHRGDFYMARINHFVPNYNQITTIDKNDRIYHYMTNLPKTLKPYFNIKFQMDISNSHPLLYSSFIIDYYNIDYDLLIFLHNLQYTNYIGDISDPLTIFRYESKQLCKLLKCNGLNENKIPMDVLVYIYRTMKGLFWDDFVRFFNEEDRSAIKASLFREVFYSKRVRITKKYVYGRKFVDLYPNVWKVLRKEKMELKKSNSLLPNSMMQLESSLFSDILTRCFERQWKVFNIHDAVVVLDIEENENCTPNEVQNIIEDVYHTRNLFPAVSLDRY